MDLSKYENWLHVGVGGVICFMSVYFLPGISQIVVRMLLYRFNSIGLLTYDEIKYALSLISFGLAYLPSGFLGGLYTGYKIKENLRVILLIPPLIGFVGLMIVNYFMGRLLMDLSVALVVAMTLCGQVMGSYLGGYTMNWEKEEEEKSETLRFDLSEVKPE